MAQSLADLQNQYDNFVVHSAPAGFKSTYDMTGGIFNYRDDAGDIAAKNKLAKQIEELKQRQAEQQRQDQFDTRLSDLMNRADPFASQRAGYQTKLSDLMSNPAGAMANNPMFAASAEAGQEAAKRRLAQMGMGTSGNAAFELQKQAQANMSGDYFRMADLLSGLAGGKSDPSAGAQAGLGMLKLGEEARQYDKDKQWMTQSPNVGYQQKQFANNLGGYWGK